MTELIIYSTDDGKAAVTLLARDGDIWMNQEQLATLFATSKQNVSLHIQNILKEKEIEKDSVVKDYLTTASDGKSYTTKFYALEMILAIGFRVRSPRGTQFRKWANEHLREFMIKGFVMDDQRLKNPDGRPDYFDELLARIRDIRASEKRFYQKVRELFSLCSDYDPADKATQMFYAETQNKLLYAVTSKTAAEIIVERASADQPNMGLTTWKGGRVRKQDITIAKNYLQEEEIDRLNRLTVIFLETAEFRARDRKDLTIRFWQENVERILLMNDQLVLDGKGSISNALMEDQVSRIYKAFNDRRKQDEARLADLQDLELLNERVKKRPASE